MDIFRITSLRITPRSTKMLASVVLIGLTIIHVALLRVYLFYGIDIMQFYSVFSAGMYPIVFFLLYKEYWRSFAVMMHVHVFTYVTLAVYCVGWGAGFQLALFAMIVLSYYSEYSARTMRVKKVSSLACSLCGVGLYYALLYYTHNHPSIYALPPDVSFGIRVLWTTVFFVIAVVYLHVFMLIAHGYESTLTHVANHDKLTSLPNRNYASERLSKIEQERGFEGHWVAMIDIDDFKQVNDTYGHNCGDYVLNTVAKLLDLSDYGAFGCRWGGEEFLLMGPLTEGVNHVELLEGIREAVSQHPFAFDNVSFSVTITIGTAIYQAGWSQDSWIKAADDRLYQGKRDGKNMVVS